MLYFSLTTLTTTGYGDIVPLDPFARSLANLESCLDSFTSPSRSLALSRWNSMISAAELPLVLVWLPRSPQCTDFCPFLRCHNPSMHRCFGDCLCAVLSAPARLWLWPSALPGRYARSFAGRGKGRGGGRIYRGDFGQCRARRRYRGRLRCSPQRSTSRFSPQRGGLLLRQRTIDENASGSAIVQSLRQGDNDEQRSRGHFGGMLSCSTRAAACPAATSSAAGFACAAAGGRRTTYATSHVRGADRTRTMGCRAGALLRPARRRG